MICLDCKCALRTTDTANFDDAINTFRRKKCPQCGRIYYTKEVMVNSREGLKRFRLKSQKYN